MKIVVRESARLNLREAVAWYENDRRGRGRKFFAVVERHLRLIARAPSTWPRWEDSPYRVLRIRGFPYSIYFAIEEREVVVYGIYHDKRRPGGWL
jgi:toxin ParE1/3/4